MEILFLGTSCAIPTASNGSTSFLVKADELLVMVDTPDNPVKSMLKAGIDPFKLDIVILTHYHADHISGYPALISTFNCMGRKQDLIVIADSGTVERANALLSVFDLDEENIGFRILYIEEFSYNRLKISLLPGFHTVPTSMITFWEKFDGGRGKRVFYTADTAYTPAIARAARGYDLLIHEATYSRSTREKPDGHSSAYEAGLSAENAGVRNLYLCHLCIEDYDNPNAPVEEAEEAYRGNVVIPELFKWYRI